MKTTKKVISAIIVVLLVCNVSAFFVAAQTKEELGVEDVLYAQKVVAKLIHETDEIKKMYDYNANGRVDLEDVLYMQKTLAKLIEQAQPEKLSDEQVKKIKEAYLVMTLQAEDWKDAVSPECPEPTLDDINLIAYYGTYGNADLITIKCTYFSVGTGFPAYIYVGGLEIPNVHENFCLHIDGEFMSMNSAYDSGKITDQDIYNMRAYYKYETKGY